METEQLVKILVEEVLKEIHKRGEKEEKDTKEGVFTAFLGEDALLKDELKKNMTLQDNIKINSSWCDIEGNNVKTAQKRLVISELCIDCLIDLSQGRKSIATEYLLNGGSVYIVEEGLEYRKYGKTSPLVKLYEEYLEKVKKIGVSVVNREKIGKVLAVKKDLYIDGVVTVEKLKKAGENRRLTIRKGSLVTASARDYMNDHNIEIYYERG